MVFFIFIARYPIAHTHCEACARERERLYEQHINLLQFAMVYGAGHLAQWELIDAFSVVLTKPAPHLATCSMQQSALLGRLCALDSAGALAALGWVVLGQRTL